MPLQQMQIENIPVESALLKAISVISRLSEFSTAAELHLRLHAKTAC